MSSFKCPECGFVQSYATLNARTGEVADNPLKEAENPCPNDGAQLLPCTDEGEFLQ